MQKYGCQKTRSSESEHRTREPLGKPMMRDGANPCAPTGAVGAIRGTRLLTRYRSEETLTRMRSSPTRTFSPSDLCFEAGCIVHQHASPKSGVTVRIMVSHNALHQGHSQPSSLLAPGVYKSPPRLLIQNVPIPVSRPSAPQPPFLAPVQPRAHL